MGSNAINLLEEDLCCPVCKKPLSSPGAPPKTKFPKFGHGKGRPPYLQSTIQAYKDTRIAVGKFKDNEEIVVAQCGHLFHKFCLRHYCYLFREGMSNHICKVSCPLCQRRISMMKSLTVEYRSHQNRPMDNDKDFTKTSIMNSELSGQKDTARNKLQRLLETNDDGGHNLEVYRSHYIKLKKELKQVREVWHEIDKINADIEQSDKMITYMKAQHLKIVRKFITKMKEKQTKDFIHFPRRLAPLLQIIEEDDKLVSDLGEIIVPLHMNDLKSDRQSILKKLVSIANERLKEKMRIEAVQNPKPPSNNHSQPKCRTREKSTSRRKPVIQSQVLVKVDNSSISIISDSTLTEESIQKIVETVESPMQVNRKEKGKLPNKIIKLINKTSNSIVDKVSASDIKIIYMPKRRMIENSSDPCRSVEENDSFFVKVPSRRCTSAEPVLVKTRKKPDKKTSARDDKTTFDKFLNRQKSNSATNLPEAFQENSLEKVILRHDVPTMTTATLNNSWGNVKLFLEKTAQIGSEKEVERDDPDHVIIVTRHDVPTMTTATLNNSWSNLKQMYEKPAQTGSVDDLVKPAENPPPSCEANNNSYAAAECKVEEQEVEELPSKTSSAPTENVSVLQVIYDNLETERQSHCEFKKLHIAKRALEAKTLDENFNFLPLLEPENDTESNSTILPAPQLFRLDKKGIPYPENPFRTSFRQPTFLASYTTCESGNRSTIMSSFDQSDEENQLNALTLEERFLRAREREVLDSTRNYYYTHNGRNSGVRPQFHGVPACLGMPTSRYRVPDSPHESVPFYMRTWQQRLPSSKVACALPKAEPRNGRFGSSRIINIPKRHFKRPLARVPRGFWQDQRECERRPETILLPPLTMSPVKRPSTAVCEAIPITKPYYPHEGPDQQPYLNFFNDYMNYGKLDMGV